MTRNEREQEARRLLALRPQGEAALRGIASVRAIGIGVRSRSGALTGELVFKVYVDAKRSPRDVPPDQMVPPEIAGVPTDVVTIGRGRTQCWDKGTRPLRGGLQVAQSPFDLTMESRGTITCMATTHDGKTALISNEHVLQHLPPHVAGTVVVNDGKVVAIRDGHGALVDTTWITGTAVALPGELVYKVGNITGLTVTEAQALRSKGDLYRAYQSSTSAFIPLPRRRHRSVAADVEDTVDNSGREA